MNYLKKIALTTAVAIATTGLALAVTPKNTAKGYRVTPFQGKMAAPASGRPNDTAIEVINNTPNYIYINQPVFDNAPPGPFPVPAHQSFYIRNDQTIQYNWVEITWDGVNDAFNNQYVCPTGVISVNSDGVSYFCQ